MEQAKTLELICKIQSTLIALQKELLELTTQLQNSCGHLYCIGWQETSTGLVATSGNIACPECGLTARITGGHTAILPPIFCEKPIYWVSRKTWKRLFAGPSPNKRIKLIRRFGYGQPPRP